MFFSARHPPPSRISRRHARHVAGGAGHRRLGPDDRRGHGQVEHERDRGGGHDLLVYAGSSQLAAIPLLVAGAPAWVILATGFCVNLRFVVFSLHLRPYLMHMPRWRRMTHGYLTADMSYALFTRKYPAAAPDRSPSSEGAGGLPHRQLLRDLVRLDGHEPAGHRAGQLHSAALGPGLCRRAEPGGASCARWRPRRCACWRR
jgi:hypothetical protein